MKSTNIPKRFYIKYNSKITEEVWEQIKTKFLELGLKQYEHSCLGLDYLNFKNKFIRTNVTNSEKEYGDWCIDNNSQWGLTEITFEEFLNTKIEPKILKDPNYEVY